MGIQFDFGVGGNSISGCVAKSQKEKMDSIIVRDGNPFVRFNVKKVNNHCTMKKSLKGNSVIIAVLGTQIQNAHSNYA